MHFISLLYLCGVSNAGEVTVSEIMDYETFPEPKQITSLLTVYEPTAPNRTANATLLVIIVDTNDNWPIFAPYVRNIQLGL